LYCSGQIKFRSLPCVPAITALCQDRPLIHVCHRGCQIHKATFYRHSDSTVKKLTAAIISQQGQGLLPPPSSSLSGRLAHREEREEKKRKEGQEGKRGTKKKFLPGKGGPGWPNTLSLSVSDHSVSYIFFFVTLSCLPLTLVPSPRPTYQFLDLRGISISFPLLSSPPPHPPSASLIIFGGNCTAEEERQE
jgi:hypothetical protein